MPESERSEIAAAIRLAILAGGAAFWLWMTWQISASYAERRVNAADRARQYAETTDSRVRHACASAGSTAVLMECVTKEIGASREDQHAEHDLQAQQDSAEAAFWMMLIGAITLSATLAALWFLKGTLDAAQATVHETRRIGEAQVRAYLAVSSLWIKRSGEWLWFVPMFKNYGQSPARKLRVKYSLNVFHTEGSTNFDSEWIDWNESVPAGDEYEGTAWHCPERLTAAQVDIWDGMKGIMIGIRLEVRAVDVFGNPFKLFASFTALPDDWEDGKFYSMPRASALSAALRGEIAKRKNEKEQE